MYLPQDICICYFLCLEYSYPQIATLFVSSLHSDLCQIPSPHKGLSLLSYVKKAFHHFIFFRVLIITCHCIIYCVAYWFITCHSTRREAACSLGLFVFSLLPLRIMLETLFFFLTFYENMSQRITQSRYAPVISLLHGSVYFFFRHRVLLEVMMSSLSFFCKQFMFFAISQDYLQFPVGQDFVLLEFYLQ